MFYRYILLVFYQNFNDDSLLYVYGCDSIKSLAEIESRISSKSKFFVFRSIKLGKFSLSRPVITGLDMIYDYKDFVEI